MSVYVLDTETTGKKDPIVAVEVAWINLSGIENLFSPLGVFDQRYNPGKPIEFGAMATHHILDEELAECPPANDFALPADAEYIIGHNIDYDWKVIGSPDVKRICTLALARSIWKDLDSYSQSSLLYFLGADRFALREKLRSAHNALVDVEGCLELLHHILAALGNVKSFDELWNLCEAARVPHVMPFGKYSGVEIAKLPADYKRWALGNLTLDPYLEKALRGTK